MKLLVATGVLALAAAPARAQTTAGVVVTGDATSQVATVGTKWLAERGYRVVDTPLPGDAISTLVDCFVIEDPGCAAAIVDQRATAHSVLFISLDARASGELGITARWLGKGKPAVERKATCTACTEPKQRAELATLLAALVPKSIAGSTLGKPIDASDRLAISTRGASRSEAPSGLAAGIELGEPSSLTIGWFTGELGFSAALGTGTFAGPGVSLHVDATRTVTRLRPNIPLYVGLGGRYYHHGFRAMSIDETPDSHYGVRATVGVALDRGPLRIYAELAPGVDLRRTSSCTLASGARSVCPHAQENPVFAQFVVGARWFVSH